MYMIGISSVVLYSYITVNASNFFPEYRHMKATLFLLSTFETEIFDDGNHHSSKHFAGFSVTNFDFRQGLCR